MPKSKSRNELRRKARSVLGVGGSNEKLFAAAAARLGESVRAAISKAQGYELLARVVGEPVPVKPLRAPRGASINPNSDEFLQSYQWRKLRMEVILGRGARCECCGRSPKQHGVAIHVDHIKPRRLYPELALSRTNLQVLCEECNHGKGNWDETDWREGPPDIPCWSRVQ